jgi:hypothetical protein
MVADAKERKKHAGPKACANCVQIPLDELIPFTRVPPLWILSACDTSVTGAMRGCFVRKLLSLGAVCVVATLAQVNAFYRVNVRGEATDGYLQFRPAWP